MGLPIAKAIVETHGGTINAVSRPGHGSVFSFSLPVEQ
jgi:signal transduction histidine kinase